MTQKPSGRFSSRRANLALPAMITVASIAHGFITAVASMLLQIVSAKPGGL